MAMISQFGVSSVLGLLGEALFLLTKNWRPLLPVLLLHLLFSCLVSLFSHLILSPILADFSSKFASQVIPGGPNPDFSLIISSMRKPIREIAVTEAFVFVLLFVFSSLVTMAIVHLLSASYSSKPLKPQDVPSLIRRTWKGPFLTQICAAVLNFSGAFLMIFLICAVMLFSVGSSGFTVGGAFISIILMLSYLFLLLISCMAVVVSVVEEGSYGLAAMARSLELTDGRKRMGVLAILAVNVIGHGGGLLAMEEGLAYSGLPKEDAAIP
ncbi:hypothetical protein HPP92_002665 [Vanilla planifolia]|uniref:Uncharacterized protein n=1 Tax=Vanilla planifolia TaxID=51239 RepID=A0A835RTQ5_VANPL|nr:hypothetical protein HPP92_003071 [Vanilla planifolia]KAG0502593.1 hypothetical protein HPP92_002665 [Vanilla planifolia]